MPRKSELNRRIQDLALALADGKGLFTMSEMLDRLDKAVSRQYVTTILRRMIRDGTLSRDGAGRGSRYRRAGENVARPTWSTQLRLEGQTDYKILEEFYRSTPKAYELPEDVRSIVAYAFTEMLNNAIDHSESEQADVTVTITEADVSFVVRDFGVGVFRNVMTKLKLNTELEAIEDLLKGKTTTAPQAHSGEGIFFTSKIADVFILTSFGKRLKIDNRLPDIFVEDVLVEQPGTEVFFQLSLSTPKHLNDIFREYQSPTDLAFDKTRAYIKLFTTGTIYVSRSQAKRVLSGIPERNFKEIILDFSQVPTIGQAFADEIFRVFAVSHPTIKLTPVNANEAVQFMIGRVNGPVAGQTRLV